MEIIDRPERSDRVGVYRGSGCVLLLTDGSWLKKEMEMTTVLAQLTVAAVLLFAFGNNAHSARDALEVEKPDRWVAYKNVGDVSLTLHVFNPGDLKETDSRSAIVFFFGGGWKKGSPSQFYAQCRHLALRGMVAMSAEYRVESRHGTTPFECIADAKSAIRYVRENAGTFGVDPNRIVASGGSAGGHIAACAGVIPGLESEGEDLSISSVPNAMVLFNPALELRGTKPRLVERFGGRAQEASPYHFVREGVPPTIVFHGREDKLIPYESVERFCAKMKEHGSSCTAVLFDNVGHGFFNRGKPYEKTLELCDEFLCSIGFLEKQP